MTGIRALACCECKTNAKRPASTHVWTDLGDRDPPKAAATFDGWTPPPSFWIRSALKLDEGVIYLGCDTVPHTRSIIDKATNYHTLFKKLFTSSIYTLVYYTRPTNNEPAAFFFGAVTGDKCAAFSIPTVLGRRAAIMRRTSSRVHLTCWALPHIRTRQSTRQRDNQYNCNNGVVAKSFFCLVVSDWLTRVSLRVSNIRVLNLWRWRTIGNPPVGTGTRGSNLMPAGASCVPLRCIPKQAYCAVWSGCACGRDVTYTTC